MLPHTDVDVDPSFYSGSQAGRASRIDFIAAPAAAYRGAVVFNPVVYSRSGRRLQLVQAARRVDHYPVGLALRSQTQYYLQSQEVRIDRDALVKCVIKGERREEFFQHVEDACEKLENQWVAADAKHPPYSAL